MKINKIKILNFLGVRNINIDVSAPVLLIHGGNAAGKSSVIKGVRAALLGCYEGVNKKDYRLLLHEGESKGLVGIECGTDKFALKVPSGSKEASFEINYTIKYLVDTYKFINQSNDDRKRFIIDLMGVESNSGVIKSELHLKLFDANKVMELAQPTIHLMYEFCREKSAALRGEWKGITGEVYGELKAKEWNPKKDNISPETRALAGSLPELNKQLDSKKKAFVISETSYHEACSALEKITPKKPHERNALVCIKCGQKHDYVSGNLVEHKEIDQEITQANESTIEAHKSSKEVTYKAWQNLSSQVKSIQDQIKNAEVAIKVIDSLSQDDSTARDRALTVHHEIFEWGAMADELGPDGMQQRMIINALKEFNNELKSQYEFIKQRPGVKWPCPALNVGCDIVCLGEDYSVTGRPLDLASESDEYKIGIMISAAIARISGLKFMMLDRVDMISPVDRGVLFNYLNWLQLDTIICAATVKERIGKTPPYMQALFVKNGMVVDD